jgi:hypothetical protein
MQQTSHFRRIFGKLAHARKSNKASYPECITSSGDSLVIQWVIGRATGAHTRANCGREVDYIALQDRCYTCRADKKKMKSDRA